MYADSDPALFPKAQQLYQQAYDTLVQTFGMSHPSVAQTLNHMANLKQRMPPAPPSLLDLLLRGDFVFLPILIHRTQASDGRSMRFGVSTRSLCGFCVIAMGRITQILLSR